MLLKAVVSKARRNIYYPKKRGQPYRTPSWTEALHRPSATPLWPTAVPRIAVERNLAYPGKLRGLLPRIYAGSNLDIEDLRGLINIFSRSVFTQGHGGEDLIGKVYEYFIGEFANSEGKRGGEYFTPASIVRTLVAMLEPTQGVVFDPCCGSGGMFVQSDVFIGHSHQLSFVGQESKDFTYRLCRMNLFIHGIDGNIQLGELVHQRQASGPEGRLHHCQSTVQ